MPLNLKCPNCGQEAVVPDGAIKRRARCITCHAIYAVEDALCLSEKTDRISARTSKPDKSANLDNYIVGFGLGIPAIAFLVFVTYWFGYRDTWEMDHYMQILDHCDAVLLAVLQGDEDAAELAYVKLNTLVGDRLIDNEDLAAPLERARESYAPIGERLTQMRQEREARYKAAQEAREAQIAAIQRRGAEMRFERELHAQNNLRLNSASNKPLFYPEDGSRDWSDTSGMQTQDLWGFKIPTEPEVRRQYFEDMEEENERLYQEALRDGLIRE